jgi:uncharacterized protein
MSTEPTTHAPLTPPAWPELDVNERRVLGVLVEKAKTTPDAYPLTLNALTTGCNQKSNRDPVLDLNDLDVEEALTSCQKKGLVFRITGGRAERWKHNLYDAWHVNKVELAVLGELLLRGAQTEGELRGRASRMEPIADLDALRATLKPLAARGLIVYLTPEGRRGTTVTHGFHAARELERLHAAQPADIGDETRPATGSTAPTSEPGKAVEARYEALEGQVAALRAEVADVQKTVAALGEQLRRLQEALGV